MPKEHFPPRDARVRELAGKQTRCPFRLVNLRGETMMAVKTSFLFLHLYCKQLYRNSVLYAIGAFNLF
jgi:hypothetical protein